MNEQEKECQIPPTQETKPPTPQTLPEEQPLSNSVTLAAILAGGITDLSRVVQDLRGALDSDKGLSASLALKELKKVRDQQEKILTAITEHDAKIFDLAARIDKAGMVIRPLLAAANHKP